MRKSSVCVLMIAVLLVSGCKTMGSYLAKEDKYVCVYGYDKWISDTGWSREKLSQYEIPLWNTEAGKITRKQVSSVRIAAVAKVIGRSRYGYYVSNPEDGTAGWLDKIYVQSVSSGYPPVNKVPIMDVLKKIPLIFQKKKVQPAEVLVPVKANKVLPQKTPTTVPGYTPYASPKAKAFVVQSEAPKQITEKAWSETVKKKEPIVVPVAPVQTSKKRSVNVASAADIAATSPRREVKVIKV